MQAAASRLQRLGSINYLRYLLVNTIKLHGRAFTQEAYAGRTGSPTYLGLQIYLTLSGEHSARDEQLIACVGWCLNTS